MTEGYLALRNTAGQIDLSSRGHIRVTGEDRSRLLHAMTTNHIQSLVPGAGCYAFFLNAVGRVLADANVLCFDDYFLLDTEPETRMFIMEHLEKYIIADDVTLEDVTESLHATGIEGPDAEAVLRKERLPVPEVPLAHAASGPFLVVRASGTGAPGFRIFGPAESLPRFPEIVAASVDDVRTVRLEHFYPRYGEDITTANLPQETGIMEALHFNKGCYLGQEIVERVRSRGHVNRMLAGILADGTEVFERGAKISFEGSEVGEITSSAYSPALNATPAIGYVRINAAKPGTRLSVGQRGAQAVAIKSSRS